MNQDKAKLLLKEHQLKVTKPRTALLECFLKAKKPLCYEDIRNHISMDKATFYRNIQHFIDTRLLATIHTIQTRQYFELAQFKHAHFVCDTCYEVSCVEDVTINLPKTVIQNITIEGTCPSCTQEVTR